MAEYKITPMFMPMNWANRFLELIIELWIGFEDISKIRTVIGQIWARVRHVVT